MSSAHSWYRQFWPLFIALMLVGVFVASVLTVLIAIDSGDDSLASGYEKTGLIIEGQTKPRERAIELAVVAVLRLDSDPLQLALTMAEPIFPSTLRLDFIHPFNARWDQHIRFEHIGNGQYRSSATPILAGRWLLQLRDEQSQWIVSAQLADADLMPVLKLDARGNF